MSSLEELKAMSHDDLIRLVSSKETELEKATTELNKCKSDKDFWYSRYVNSERNYKNLVTAIKSIASIADDNNNSDLPIV